MRSFVRIAERIESAATLVEADRRFLRARHVDLLDQWKRVRFERAPAVVHGDAYNENLVRCGDGRIVCMDLERVGQPEWDLTVTAVYPDPAR